MGADRAARIVLYAALMFATAFAAAPPASAQIVVRADYGWLYAKSSCRGVSRELEPERFIACTGDPAIDFEAFVSTLETQFASNGLCRDVSIVRVGPRSPRASLLSKEGAEKLNAPHWIFWVNFAIGTEFQYWYVDSNDNRKLLFQGTGKPEQIARDVCSAVTGRGATIVR